MKYPQRRTSAARRSGLGVGAVALALAIGMTAPSAALAQAAPSGAAGRSGYEIVVGTGKSQVIEFPTSYSDLMLADPKVADVLPLTARSVYVVGKGAGSTAL